MRIYISADIEGVAGITAWEEGRKSHPDYAEFRRRMTAEVAAACEGAKAAGADAITVKDAHGSARNLLASELPRPVRLIRGWSGHPFGMVQELDESFDACLFIGYHARAGAGGNPLAHTMSSMKVAEVRINDEPVSEYRIHAWAAELVGVPVAFVSADRSLCDEVAQVQPATRCFATKWGEGASQNSLHPGESCDGIRSGVQAALSGELAKARIRLPARFALEVDLKSHAHAYARSFYPGAKLAGPHTVRLETDDYFEVLRALLFII